MNRLGVGGWFFVILVSLVIVLFVRGGDGYSNISPHKAQELIAKDTSIVLLDVRTPAEFSSETGHLGGAKLIPVQELEQRMKELEPLKGRMILVYCRSGYRSSNASALLSKHGFKVMNLEGGIVKWDSEKLPVVFEKTK